MLNVVKKIWLFSAAAIASAIMASCESETDNLGSQFFQSGTAQGNQNTYDVIAYNVSNNDSVRTDPARLATATLGAFKEPIFGLQKAAYVSQVRLSSYAPDFGTNPVADSAVLVIKPNYPTDSLTTTTNTAYTYPVTNVSAKQVVNTYPITKYGRTKINGATSLTLQVSEVTDFIGTADKIFSNKNVNTGAVLGTKTIVGGNINSVSITANSDNSTLVNAALGIRIPLDATYFQNKILTQGSSQNLADAASFTRYMNGLQIAVTDNDGYLFQFKPSDVSLVLYYKNDVTSGTTTTRTSQTFSFDMTPANNIYFNQFQYDRSGSAVQAALASPNTVSGDAKLYVQGMGGPGFGVRIPASVIAGLKNQYNQQKIGIISAKIRLYTDVSTWNNNYPKPDSFIARQQNLYTYLQDALSLGSAGYQLTRAYNLTSNPAYYDLSITKTLSDIIQNNSVNQDLIINAGSYTLSSANVLTGITSMLNQTQLAYSQYFNTRAYTPYRAVLVGTDPANTNRAQLIVTYGQK